ncbi:MAG: hypothetical protein JSV27_10950 [Candidatus Bathyarchaeota archaeon]|nr:MAG: hypothetical protein JSV27_10950 [Candidatus Bathyarchaeota archaeon]
MDQIREREEREKEEVLGLLREQLKVEGQLIALYNETVPTIGNRPVRHLVDMIALDSRKHVSICQAAIDILEGEEVLSDDKPPLHEGIERHLELEEGSTERANKILGNVWIREN